HRTLSQDATHLLSDLGARQTALDARYNAWADAPAGTRREMRAREALRVSLTEMSNNLNTSGLQAFATTQSNLQTAWNNAPPLVADTNLTAADAQRRTLSDQNADLNTLAGQINGQDFPGQLSDLRNNNPLTQPDVAAFRQQLRNLTGENNPLAEG